MGAANWIVIISSGSSSNRISRLNRLLLQVNSSELKYPVKQDMEDFQIGPVHRQLQTEAETARAGTYY
jgi:hypothetical protein